MVKFTFILILSMLVLTGCNPADPGRNYDILSNAKSARVFYYNRETNDTIVVTLPDVPELNDIISAEKSPEYKCGYDGAIRFDDAGGKEILAAEFNLSGGCLHAVYTIEDETFFRKLTDKGTGLLKLNMPKIETRGKPLNELEWILGDWIQTDGFKTTTETWKKENDFLFIGRGMSYDEGDTSKAFIEKIRLESRANGIFYVAHPAQNISPTGFLMTAWDKTMAKFENPEHDFPSLIRYIRSDDTLNVEVKDQDNKGFELIFKLRRD